MSERMPVAVGSARSVYNKARRQMPDNGVEDDIYCRDEALATATSLVHSPKAKAGETAAC